MTKSFRGAVPFLYHGVDILLKLKMSISISLNEPSFNNEDFCKCYLLEKSKDEKVSKNKKSLLSHKLSTFTISSHSRSTNFIELVIVCDLQDTFLRITK